MSSNPDQIYSATYSNVPVFEFVTAEGPIMRRKSDSWINATHILKIAKFPKAKRTRILEKDVQTGIHEKVQGGYGKYQGTYVPLELGAEIARSFNVFEVLRPIFDFQYVEGKSSTPPPAPKHSHASASNVARRQYIQQQKQTRLKQGFDEDEDEDDELLFKRMKPSISENGEAVKKRGRPKRVALPTREKPDLRYSQTMPISTKGPSMGTFSSKQDQSFSLFSQMVLPPLMRQDTEKDTIQFMANNMNLKNEDLEAEDSGDDDESSGRFDNSNINDANRAKPKSSAEFGFKDTDDDELMTGRELFGSRDSFAASRDSFEKIVQMHSRYSKSQQGSQLPKVLSINGSLTTDGYGLPPFHHTNQYSPLVNSSNIRGDSESVNYFNSLLNFFLEDDGQLVSDSTRKDEQSTLNLPEKILNPPQPLSKIKINQPIDNDGNTIFHWACSMANVGMIEFLLSIFSNFIDTDVKNYHGETPLMFMTQFNNSYQLKNFSAILDLLFDCVLSVDNYGRTVLHHIVSACKPGKAEQTSKSFNQQEGQKQRFSKYYLELLLAKIVDLPEYQLLQGTHNGNLNDKKELISKFINHQDNEGNTAFHIASYNMSKKCVMVFIKYHKFIDFNLRNLVSFTAEDYLASHNYVLRLDNGTEDLISTQDESSQNGVSAVPNADSKSFDAQLHKTQLAISSQNLLSNQLTQKLAELAYVIEKELKEKDEKLLSIFRFSRLIAFEKFQSQKRILELFNLGYLVEDVEKDFETTEEDIQGKSDLLLDNSRDLIIQDEINRLQNDMMFQYLFTTEEYHKAIENYTDVREKQIRNDLERLERECDRDTVKDEPKKEQLPLAIQLQEEILKRKKLALLLYEQDVRFPPFVEELANIKERDSPTSSKVDVTEESNAEKENEFKESMVSDDSRSRIASLSKDSKLYKYCKLISLSCGMTFAEVESSIDLIEQSLSRGPASTSS